jgi:hypothetical protein
MDEGMVCSLAIVMRAGRRSEAFSIRLAESGDVTYAVSGRGHPIAGRE